MTVLSKHWQNIGRISQQEGTNSLRTFPTVTGLLIKQQQKWLWGRKPHCIAMAGSDCLLILSCDKRPIMASTHLEILVQCKGCVLLDKALLCNIPVLHALIDTLTVLLFILNCKLPLHLILHISNSTFRCNDKALMSFMANCQDILYYFPSQMTQP